MGIATLYGIRNCDTGIAAERLNRWCAELGWEALLNRSGATFRKLSDAQKQDLDRDRAMALMLAQPSMIKRPVTGLGDRLVVGFKPELYKSVQWR